MDYTSYPYIARMSSGASRDEVGKLCEEIEGLVRDDVARTNSLEEGEAPTADTPAPSPGVASRVKVVTRPETRADPNNEDTDVTAFICGGTLTDEQLRLIDSLAYNTERRTNLAHEGEHI